MMHAGVGTALGGVMTMVGEPQNLIIAHAAGWSFGDFLLRVAPVSVPVFICGIVTCILVEKTKSFGYGEPLPEPVRKILREYDDKSRQKRTRQDTMKLIIQGLIGVWLITALALHLAEVGLIGLSVIILASSLCGRHRRARYRQSVYRSAALYRPADSVLRRGCRYHRPASLRADYRVCARSLAA
ncbi:Sodium/proton antiporter nhaB [Cronobacter sakazakii]|nr:Sodium/proton antiporter nhaB [Cronobacter sakazakii]